MTHDTTREHTGFIDDTFDPSLKELQHCTASSGKSVEVLTDIGISNSVVVDGQLFEMGICPDEIWWYKNKLHFNLSAPVEGDLDFQRDTVSDDDADREQTEAGAIKESKKLTIKGSHSSEFLQMMRNIKMADSTGGYGGRLLKAYSNGGLHLRTTVKFIEEGTGITEYALNVKITKWPETFVDFDNDSEIELEFLIEYDYYYEIIGNFIGSLGLPESDLELATTITQTPGTDITITPSVTDSYGILDESFSDILVTVNNQSTSVKSVFHTKVKKDQDIVIPTIGVATGGDVLNVQYHWFVGRNVIAPAKQELITVEGSATKPVITTTTTEASTVKDVPLNDDAVIALFGASVTEGRTLTVDQSAVKYDTPSDVGYDVVFKATDADDVTVTLKITEARVSVPKQ